MNRDRDVAKHGLGSHRGDANVEPFARIADLPDLAVFLLGVDLEVGHRGTEHRVPVDQPLASIDETLFVQLDEDFHDRTRHARVHREVAGFLSFGVGVIPIGGSAEAAHLARDGRARLVLPLPYALDELLAPEVVAALAFLLELALDHDLGGDAGVVGADHPVGVVAAHAAVADERVHEGLLERVAHVQRAGDVGRRQLDAVRRRDMIVVPEAARFFPAPVPGLLDHRRVEALVDHSGFFGRSAKATEAATASRTICVTLTVISARTPSSAWLSTVFSVRARRSSTTRSTSGPRRSSTARSRARASASSAASSTARCALRSSVTTSVSTGTSPLARAGSSRPMSASTRFISSSLTRPPHFPAPSRGW